MIDVVLWYIQGWWNMTTAIYVGVFVVSVAAIPLTVGLLKRSTPMNEKIARVLFTVGMKNLGRGALVLTDERQYTMAPVDRDGETATVALEPPEPPERPPLGERFNSLFPDVKPQGEGGEAADAAPEPRHDAERDGIFEVANPRENWTRLGLAPFTVTYRKVEGTFGEFRANLDEADGMPIKADGGEFQVFGEPRGGKYEWSPYTSEPDDAYLIDFPRLIRRLHDFGAGGSEGLNEAEEQTLKEEGGDSEMGQMLFLSAICFALLLGAGMAYMVMVM